ncbi:MAG: mannose-1-phosphate guanylyltransferase/mannose-6-phosphate isomerase [Kiloniellales bacterium]
MPDSRRVTPVILSGGSGTRLWPLSRASYPKQLMALTGESSLLLQTAARVADPARFAPPLVICNAEHRFLVAEQLLEGGLAPQALVLEPVGRNTAPAACIAALLVAKQDPAGLLLLLPSDHHIADGDGFRAAARTAAEAAAAGWMVTFGVKPQRPETGFGYIQVGEALAAPAGAHQVARFVEKPDRATAEDYLAGGQHLWNSGMFLFRADRFVEELERFQPAMLEACRAALAQAQKDLDFLRLDEKAFAASPSDSIDYAVMEKTGRAAVVPVDIGWSDVGSWQSLWEISARNAEGNVLSGDVIAVDSRNSYLQSKDRLLAAVGVDDLVVVTTKDAVLVCHRDKAQDIKAIVDRLKGAEREEYQNPARVNRPWGSYQSIDTDAGFQAKRLVIKPGASISLQRHRHRAEHWVVVQGVAEVTRDDEVFTLQVNQSVFIPLGAVHRLRNPGSEPLTIVEVQCGDYLGEDDIERFEDVYGRTGNV